MKVKTYTETHYRFVDGLHELTKERPELKRIDKYILSLWLYESGFFSSKLAREHNNVGGMKWRPGCPVPHGLVEYKDWEGKTEHYFSVPSPEIYAHVWHWFITRNKRYQPFFSSVDAGESGPGCIRDLVFAGYCTAIANSERNPEVLESWAREMDINSVIDDEKTEQDIIAINYARRVWIIANRPDTEDLLNCRWLDKTANQFGKSCEIEIPEWAKLYGIERGGE